MSVQTARRLSWSLLIVSALLALGGLIISILALLANPDALSFSHHLVLPLVTMLYSGVGTLVATRQSRNPLGWIFCVIGLLSGLNMGSAGYELYDQLVMPLPGAVIAQWFSLWLWIPNILLPLTFVLLLFPDGKLLSPRWRPIGWVAGLGLAIYTVAGAFHPELLRDSGKTEAGPAVVTLTMLAIPLLLIAIGSSIASVVIRFRKAVGVERAQLKWLVWAGILVVVLNVAGGIPWYIWGDTPLTQEIYILLTSLSVASIVLATGIAILRYRLWDIELLINRTVVYTLLTTLVITLYIGIVGGLGVVLQRGGNQIASLFGTAVVAVSFQPLREYLQRLVNRLMYGERDNPYAVLGRLSERLEVVVAAPSVLPTIVETVAEAFKLPYTAIALRKGDSFPIIAEYVRSSHFARGGGNDVEILPLVYQSDIIGRIILAWRAPGEPFSQSDMQLFKTIAQQASIAAYNVRLTQELQRSRERLVTTREEERRRLRRDLHDGLGPMLAAMSYKLDAVHNLADRDTNAVRRLVAEIKTQMQVSLADIRRIAYDLRPPALDELGLVGALKEHIAAHNQGQALQITLDAPEDPPLLPAAVEVAAYRIVLEAMTNVSRHAGARHCSVRLSLPNDLWLEVTDDGNGLSQAARTGVGLTSMRERAEELGGTCNITALPQGGTGVMACLPVSADYLVGV